MDNKASNAEIELQKEIDKIDKEIKKLQVAQQSYIQSLHYLQINRLVNSEPVLYNPDTLTLLPKRNNKPLKPNEALMLIFNQYPTIRWTTLKLKSQLEKMKSTGMLDSSGQNLLWIVHNGLRILDKRKPKPIKKVGYGRSAYYIKNLEVDKED